MSNQLVNQEVLKIQAEIAEKQKQLDELNRKLEEAKKKGEMWRANLDERYFFIHQTGHISPSSEDGSQVDDDRFNFYNYFQTSEEAEQVNRVQLAYRKLKHWIEKFEVVAINSDYGFAFAWNINDIKLYNAAYKINSLPRLRHRDDAQYILDNFKEELTIFLKGG